MLSGRDSLHIINQRLVDSRQEVDGLNRRMLDISHRISEIRGHKAGQYRELAQFRLDEMTARRVIDGINEAETAVSRLLSEKEQAMRQLEIDAGRSLERQAALAERRDVQETGRDRALEDLEAKLAEVREKLAGEEGYRLQLEACQTAADQAEKAEAKATRAEEDRASKGQPYETDKLFMYLWLRRHGTPDYDAGGLIRILDNWVARLIDFGDARSNYFMLTELPLRLGEHAARVRALADRQGQALAAMEREAAVTEGVPVLQASFDDQEKALHRIDDEIEDAEKAHAALMTQRTLFSTGDDDFTRRALALLSDQLKQKPLADLHREAQSTQSPSDDVIVARIRELSGQERELDAQLLDLKISEAQNQTAMGELEKLRQWFRRQNYDSQYSRFPGGFTLALLLEQLLRGRTSGSDIRERIRRNQSFRLPRTRRGRKPRGGFGGGFGGGAGGGFGGGFGTGGGFGGGGGFRTGGGF